MSDILEVMDGSEIESLLEGKPQTPPTTDPQLEAKRISDEKAREGRKAAEEKRLAQVAEAAARAATEATTKQLNEFMSKFAPQQSQQPPQQQSAPAFTMPDDPLFEQFDQPTRDALKRREQLMAQNFERILQSQQASMQEQLGGLVKQHTGQIESSLSGMKGMVFETSIQSHAPKYASLQTDSEFDQWNNSPNPLYGGQTPSAMMQALRNTNNPSGVVALANAQVALYESQVGSGSAFRASPNSLPVTQDIAATKSAQKPVRMADLQKRMDEALNARDNAMIRKLADLQKQLEREGRLVP